MYFQLIDTYQVEFICCRSEEGSVRQSTFRYRVDPTNTSGVVFLVGHDYDGDDKDKEDNKDGAK